MSNANPNNNPFANWHSPVSEIDDPAVLQAYQDAMEEVHTRFILNLPPEEFATADRILFQIEQAWWFYEDFICDNQDTNSIARSLPRFKHLKPFAVEMFQFSPLLNVHQFHSMWEQFSKYKRKISTYGCILLNHDCTKLLLCQDWNSKSWTFPAGKINQGEEGIDAAARETFEETGFDPNCKWGLSGQMDATWKFPLQENNAVSFTEESGKHRTFYICQGVPEDFPFDPVARKEVALVQWHPLEKVPKKNHAMLPVLNKVRRWIKRNYNNNDGGNKNTNTNKRNNRDRSNKRDATPNNKNNRNARDSTNTTPLKSNKSPNPYKEKLKDHDSKKTPNRDRNKKSSRSRSRGKSSVIGEDDPLLESGLACVGSVNRWSEEDMFQANERLLGRKIEYDGNPHVFSEQGFQGVDPHHFRVVGGNFLNSETNTLAPPPPTSRLQHLFRTKGIDDNATGMGNAGASNAGGDDESEFLTPFFSDDGATPWGEVVQEVKETVLSPERKIMVQASSKPKTKKDKKQQQQSAIKDEPTAAIMVTGDDSDLAFMTDQEITQRSQKVKLAQWHASKDDEKYNQDMQDIQEWVNKLPRAAPTKQFGEFKFNVDSLMEALYQHY